MPVSSESQPLHRLEATYKNAGQITARDDSYTSVDVREMSFGQYFSLRITELFRFKYALRNAVLSALKRRYRRSTLGFAWSLLNPLLTMMVLALMFGTLFRQNYHLFSIYVFSALLPWGLIAQTMTQSTESLVNNESSLRMLLLPKAFFPLVTVASELVNFSLSLAVFLLLGLALGGHYNWTMIAIPLATVLTGIFCFALAICFSITAVFCRDVSHILGVVVQLLFYMTPIIYPVNSVPADLRWIINLNPFYCFVKLFRYPIYDGQWPHMTDWLICTLLAVAGILSSFYLLQRTERGILFRL